MFSTLEIIDYPECRLRINCSEERIECAYVALLLLRSETKII